MEREGSQSYSKRETLSWMKASSRVGLKDPKIFPADGQQGNRVSTPWKEVSASDAAVP
jgi:hypothetical protein